MEKCPVMQMYLTLYTTAIIVPQARLKKKKSNQPTCFSHEYFKIETTVQCLLTSPTSKKEMQVVNISNSAGLF